MDTLLKTFSPGMYASRGALTVNAAMAVTLTPSPKRTLVFNPPSSNCPNALSPAPFKIKS
ncbi:MAG: hypothetical protein BWY72_02481 [Bacteroidetes bacterium ADurb.Bin416]|nr:MAG: hypothetical protein BWY72_02481 [Bacteroidetes bacterium ADurb.Bin416]